MGRTSNPIPNPNNAPGRLAQHLRDGLARRRLSYRELAAITRYHATTLQRAADGKHVSTWEVVSEFASACNLDLDTVRGMWKTAHDERHGRRGPQTKPVGVEQITTYAELGLFLVDLRERKGSPSYRLIERRALTHWKWFGRLPHSTAQRIGTRQTSRPTLNQMRAFLVGCGIPPERHGDLVRAWHRANIQYQEERARHAGEQPAPEPNRALAKFAREQTAIQTAHDLGYAPLEPFRGHGQPWSVVCLTCEKNRRIRLEWEIERQRQQREAGIWEMRCPTCVDHPASRAQTYTGAGSRIPAYAPPLAVLTSGRGMAR
ncbi:hypothetical protein [Streptomyces sp. NPDC054975]